MRLRSRSSSRLGGLAFGMLLALLCTGQVQAAPQDLNIPCNAFSYSYALQPNQAVLVNPETIATSNPDGNEVVWSVTNSGGNLACTGGPTSWNCAGLTITIPADSQTPTAETNVVTITGTGASPEQEDVLTITSSEPDGSKQCTGAFKFHTTATGGGWGDPHLTTVDGIHYDFQSAGEFTSLRGSDFELQTRQTPVPTSTIPITNSYTGITHCVAIYTAMAARLGASHVSVQPFPGDPNSQDMQVWVNGKPVTIGTTPFVVQAESGSASTTGTKGTTSTVDGTITRLPDGVFDITNADGTQIVVTPTFWNARQLWYLSISVYGTSGNEGPMGRLAEGSWLPAMPDGSSLGPKPDSIDQRYQDLYEKFADAWRVTDTTSLFHYESGTTTATFTLKEWPRNHPESCDLEGQTSATPATAEVAQQACANVTDAAQKADCVFDVTFTGETGFGKHYETMQKFKPRGPGWFTPVPRDSGGGQPPCKGWQCWPWWYWLLIALAILLLILLLRALFGKKPAGP